MKGAANTINEEMIKDIDWWLEFLPDYDGISILWIQDRWEYNQLLASDASLVGGGAVCGNSFFHVKFTPHILDVTSNIAQREMYMILLALELWAHELRGKVIRFLTDNQVSMFAINRGQSHDKFMLWCLRKIVYITAKNDILIEM